jgi:hypothetical protein
MIAARETWWGTVNRAWCFGLRLIACGSIMSWSNWQLRASFKGSDHFTFVNQQRYVVAHQAIGVTAPTKALHYPSQGGQVYLAVLILTKDSLACIAARDDMIESPGNSMRSERAMAYATPS